MGKVPTPTPVVIPGEDKSDEKLYYSTLLYHQSSSDDLSEELFFSPSEALAKDGYPPKPWRRRIGSYLKWT
jgi:hypothetical protein